MIPSPPPPDGPSQESRGRLSSWGWLGRVALLLIALACLGLVYPFVRLQICLSRVAASYELVLAPPEGRPPGIGTSQLPLQPIEQFRLRPGVDVDSFRMWQEELANQPVSRLLGLLGSKDPVTVWVGAVAIDTQLTQGRLRGWPGKRQAVPPLDDVALDRILASLERDLPEPVVESLTVLLLRVRGEEAARRVFLRAIASRHVMVRAGMSRYHQFLDPRSTTDRELLNRWCRDPSPEVRVAILTALDRSLAAVPPDRQARYLEWIDAAARDGDSRVRQVAARALAHRDLNHDATFERAAELLQDPQTRLDALMAIAGRSASPLLDGPRTRSPGDLPARYVEFLFQLSNDPEPQWRKAVQGCLLANATLPAEQLWPMVEEQLKQPAAGRSPLVALFDPQPPDSSDAGPGAIDLGKLYSKLHGAALEARPRLIAWASDAVRGEDEARATQATWLLRSVAPEQPEWLYPALSHRSGRVRTEALRDIEATDAVLPRIIELVRSDDPATSAAAISALKRYRGVLAERWQELLFGLLRAPIGPAARQGVFDVLKAGGAGESDLRQVLTAWLLDDEMKGTALWKVRQYDWSAALRPQLIAGLREGRLGSEAATLLVEAGEPFEAADARLLMAVLVKAIPPPRAKLGAAAPAGGLTPASPGLAPPVPPEANFGRAPIMAAPAGSLSPLARRVALVRKLIELSPPDAVAGPLQEGLLSNLRQADADARQASAELLAETTASAEGIAGELTHLLNDKSSEARLGGLEAISALGARARQASGAVITRLVDSETRVRVAATDALAAIGPAGGAPAAAALIRSAKQDRSTAVRVSALAALGRLGPLAKPWRSALQELMDDRDAMVRNQTRHVLNELARDPLGDFKPGN
jgi:HEAT repeat protein